MTNSAKLSLLDEQLAVLLRHFGATKVRAALQRAISNNIEKQADLSETVEAAVRSDTPTAVRSDAPTLEELRKSDQAKHRLLSKFREDLIGRKVLPETQDIYQFAQLIGLKELKGKARRDMIPVLIDYLISLPMKRLRSQIKSASTISEVARRQGFSVLTDKLLRNR